MNAGFARLNPLIGPSCRSAGGRLVLAREAFWFWCPRPIALAARRIGFALLGESLLAVAPKGTKRSCPYIRVSLRSTSLIPSPLRGPAYKGHPWPFTPLAASMPLAPLRSDSIRPPERGVRRRLMVRSRKNRKSVSSQQRCVYLPSRNENLVGWKTAKHFPPQSSLRWISNFAFENRWVSFALPTLRSLKARTTASPLGPLHTTESPIWEGRAQVPWRGLSHVGWKTAKHFPPQSSPRSVSNFPFANRWVSFALPTLRSLEGRTIAFPHGPSDTTESPLSEGRAQVAWKGLSGMDAARAAMGQGWPYAAGPWNVTGAREPRRSRGRMQGQDFLVPFGATAKRDSPSRAKPLAQPTTTKSHYTRGQSHYRLAATCSGCNTSQVLPC